LKRLAYELRYLDEDDACKPDLTLEPLDESQRVYEYFLDSVVNNIILKFFYMKYFLKFNFFKAFNLKSSIKEETKQCSSVIDEILENHQVGLVENVNFYYFFIIIKNFEIFHSLFILIFSFIFDFFSLILIF